MKIVSVVGARPQFIKLAPVSRALRAKGITELLVHTGQHYDQNMSALFFEELDIPQPDFNLGVGSGNQGWQTGQMLARIEKVLLEENPDGVLVYGDTNSTLAAALAAVKLHIPVAHVEAGLRSFNRRMPEEHNRVLTDHMSELLFCPTLTAVKQLRAEGITQRVFLTGDVMYDAVLYNTKLAAPRSDALSHLELDPGEYMLATVHRPQNTDDPHALSSIFHAFGELGKIVILPVHPRTRAALTRHGIGCPPNVRLVEPVGYLDMLVLEKNARLILTDSGGVQKEAYFLAVPCITLRQETEWVETVEAGWNRLAGSDTMKIIAATREFVPPNDPPAVFGDGHASEQIAELMDAMI
jgi:UDP-GlcNAc3NAcA epimerase